MYFAVAAGMAMVFNEAPELHPDLPTNFPTCQKDMELDDDEFQTYYNTPYGEKPQIREENNEPSRQIANTRGENNGKSSHNIFFFILLVGYILFTHC